MRAWLLEKKGEIRQAEVPDPEPGPGEIVVDVSACGICRTDVHMYKGEIDLPVLPITPGHQAVGRVGRRGEGADRFPIGARVGVAWLHETCGACAACRRGDENLCPNAKFTGYHVPGGFAEKVKVRQEFAYPMPESIDDFHAAPLLCAGIIGYRSMRQADVSRDESVGLYGFGSAASIAIQVARHRRNRVFVVTRSEESKALARRMGAVWVGGSDEAPPEPLDRVVIFASAGELVPRALEAVRWGGTVASAAIHMSPIPQMDYTKDLFGERTLRSTTASTRRDGEELMQAADEARVRTQITLFDFEDCEKGLQSIANDTLTGSAVLKMNVVRP